MLSGSLDTTHLDVNMGLSHAPVIRRGLHHGGTLRIVTEDADIDTWYEGHKGRCIDIEDGKGRSVRHHLIS